MVKQLHRWIHGARNLSWLTHMPAMLAWAVVAGVLGAFATIAFHAGMHAILVWVTGQGDSIVGGMQALPWWGRVLFPTVGGLVAGALLWWAGRLKRRSNSDYMEAVAIGDGRLSFRLGMLRSLSSLSTVASGGSIGREGAMVHLAAMASSLLGRLGGFSTPRLRLLVACGAAAGVASAYGAPVAGALFVAEIVLGSMSMRSLGPMLLAAASANLTMRMTGYYQVIYAIDNVPQADAWALLPFIGLGLLSGVAAPAFLKGLDAVKRAFQRSGLPLPVRLAAGGLLLGLLLASVPELAGNGYDGVAALLHASWAWHTVLLMLALKVIATALTVGSGAIGGVFTPALFVGGALGWLFAAVLGIVWPGVSEYAYLYTIAGMGSFLGAATGAPLMAILMMFEMTLAYQVVLPLMVTAVVAYFTARAVAEVAMYEVTVTRERDALLRQRLRSTRIQELIRPAQTVVAMDTPLPQALQLFLDYPVKYVYVVDDDSVYQGVIAQQDLTGLLLNESELESRNAGDVLRLDFVKPLYPDMTLDQAQDAFIHFTGERLPVVNRHDPHRLLGVVYKSSVLETYSALKKSMDTSGEAMLDYPIVGPGR